MSCRWKTQDKSLNFSYINCKCYQRQLNFFYFFGSFSNSCPYPASSHTYGVHLRPLVHQDTSIFNTPEGVKFLSLSVLRRRGKQENERGKCLNGEQRLKKNERMGTRVEAEVLGSLTAGIVNWETTLPTCLHYAKEN